MRVLILFVPLLLAACTGGTAGPSLGKRPVENVSLSEPEPVAAVPAPADAALTTRISGLAADARAGQSAFAGLLARARAAAASAGAEGGESWIAAQQALSALEAARAPTTRAVAELDALVAARVAGGEDAGLAELQAAQAEAGALAEAQQRTVDELRARISR